MRNKILQLKNLLIKLKQKGLGDIFLSSVFNELIGFIVSIFIVRMFSKDEYGYYAIAYNIYGYISVFIGCGLNNGVLQYCSELRPEGQKKAIYLFCRRAGSIFNIILLVCMPILSLILLNGQSRYYFMFMSGWPLVAYLSNYYLMRLRVIKDNRHFMLSNVISSLVFIGTAVLLVNYSGIWGYIVSLYVKYIILVIVAHIFLKKKQDDSEIEVIRKPFKFEIICYSLICCLTNFASNILMLGDVTCINYFIGDAAAVATYKTATQIPVALLFVPSNIIVFAFPYLVENNKNYVWLKKNSKKLLAGIFAVNLSIALGVIIFAPLIVNILWGERYLDVVPILRTLTINFLVTGSFNMVFGNIMVAIKKVNVNLIKTIVSSCLNIILNILMLKNFGSIGAAYATLIVSVGSSVFSVLYFVAWIRREE